MASLNDIESQLDTIISLLPDAVANKTTVIPLVVDSGHYYFPENVTFSTIEDLLDNGVFPFLETGELIYQYVGTTPNPQGEGPRVHSWSCVLPNVPANTVVISCFYQNLDAEHNNEVYPLVKTIS